jgi:hypothetical protein
MAEDLGRVMQKERSRLSKLKESLAAKRAHIDKQLADADRELAAIDAYTSARGGKVTRKKGKAAGAPRGPRGPREGGRRDQVLAVIKEGDGLGRGEILSRMGIVEKENKGAAQSVSNALSALKKAGTVKAEGGKYTIA